MNELQTNPLLPAFLTRKVQLLLVLLFSLALNINTLRNTYALDDELVIGNNMNVHKGIAGIGTILSTDAYQGFLDQMAASTPLSGGRYRPLSIVTFALEEQLFGEPKGKEYLAARKQFEQLQASAADIKQVEDAAARTKALAGQIKDDTMKLAPVRHAFQVIYFALSMLVLFIFLSDYLLPQQKHIAFLATLLFVFHPIHTEVVANIKSRDEILSLLFILLSCIFAFRYNASRKAADLAGLLLSALAALLSKEYAVLLPFVAFTALAVSTRQKPVQLLKTPWFISLVLLDIAFMAMRSAIIGKNKVAVITDVLNDPYLYATKTQRLASKIAVLLEYVKLLMWPHPLSSDYAYSHFPYRDFSDPIVWLSILFWLAVVALAVWLWQKRHVLGFALLFFLSFFMLVNNMVFEIGATMGERLIYHSSLGFCIIAAWLIGKGIGSLSNANARQLAFMALAIALLLPMGYKTIARNADWKSDYTLFTQDVKSIPNSAMTNANAGAEYYNLGHLYLKGKEHPTHADTLVFQHYADTALGYLNKSIGIHKRYVSSYMNRALCYVALDMLDSAIADWKTAAANFNGRNQLLTQHALLVLTKGKRLGFEKNYAAAAQVLRDAAQIDGGNAEIWDNLGGSEFMQGHFAEATQAFNNALALNPNLQDAKQGAMAAANYVALQEQCRQDSLNPQVWLRAADAFRQGNFTQLADSAAQRARALRSR